MLVGEVGFVYQTYSFYSDSSAQICSSNPTSQTRAFIHEVSEMTWD
jgi:hypothetical protein